MTIPHYISDNLVHVAAIFTLICFLFRDQIKLRIFAALGDALLSLYYYLAFDQPLWTPMVWSIMNVVINVSMILIILKDGRISEMTDNEMNLFRNLDSLTPGQFRKLMKIGAWHHPDGTVQLTEQGKMPDKLYYVLDGEVTIDKSGRGMAVDPKTFIGEIAFLRDKPASATVNVAQGATYVSWDQQELREVLRKDDDLKRALGVLISTDMADKVARS